MMPNHQLSLILRHIRSLVNPSSGQDSTDADLLARFVAHRDEAAFAAVLERHGPLVLGVCRRVLDDTHDAEDAFQATFLVLVRRADSIRRGASLASWLHGVAFRVALEARTRAARRRLHEKRAAAQPCGDPPAEDSWAEVRPLLDEEMRRLPEKYRAPLVLHYLEGKTKQQAARQLGWTEGTVSGRLDRARKLLRQRLVRRGVALSVGAFVAVISAQAALAAVPPELQKATLRAGLCFGAASAGVASLTEAALRVLFVTRLKAGVSLLLLVGVLAVGTGMAARYVSAPLLLEAEANGPLQPAAQQKIPPPPAAPAPEEPDEDEGPGLKDRAVARLEAMTLERWEASWKTDLDVSDRPAGVVLRRLARDLGLTVEATAVQERVLAQSIRLKLRSRARLELIEEVCRRLKLYPVYPDGATSLEDRDKILRLKEGPRPLPVTFAGPFLVEVGDLKEFAPSATGELRLHVLAIGLPPAVGLPMSHGEPIAVKQITGRRGQDLIDTGRGPSWTGTESYVGFDVSKYLYLKNLLRGVTAIRAVEGRLRVPLVSRVETLRFEELKAGASKKIGDVRVTLRGITQRRQKIIVDGVEQDRQGFDFRFRGVDFFHLEFIGYDARGRLLWTVANNGAQSTKEGYHIVGYSKPPASITAKVLAELQHIDYPFRLENVPLPAHERMPERLEPLEFPGHPVPVTVEVVKLLRDKQFATVELRAVNHANKDVRQLHLRLLYLDAEGRQLKDWPVRAERKSGPPPDVPILVARKDEGVVQATAFFMPPKTKTVRAAIQRVEFADATEWNAQSDADK